MSEAHVRHGNCAVTKSPYGSIVYDCEKGTMPLEWENEDAFLVWLAAEEHKNVIQLVVSRTEHSDSPNWWAQHVYRCSQEFSGGIRVKRDQVQSNQKISTKKTGCWYRLTIKMYPHTETILGKYEGQHDDMPGLSLSPGNHLFVLPTTSPSSPDIFHFPTLSRLSPDRVPAPLRFPAL